MVAIAHAIVLRGMGESFPAVCADCEGEKKAPHDKLAAKLEEGAEIVKSVYR